MDSDSFLRVSSSSDQSTTRELRQKLTLVRNFGLDLMMTTMTPLFGYLDDTAVEMDSKNDSGIMSKEMEDLAKEHARVIVERDALPGSVMEEIEMLIRCLLVDPESGGGTLMNESNVINSRNAARYASMVLSLIPLESLGPQICDLLGRLPGMRRFAPETARRCAKRGVQSSHTLSHGRVMPLYQLPFRDETDSRRHFVTVTQSALFQSRERIRDGFGIMLHAVFNQLRGLHEESGGVASVIRESAEKCTFELRAMPANHAWFARAFIEQMLNVANHDARTLYQDVKGLAREDKIEKLSRRVLSPRATPFVPSAAAASSGAVVSGGIGSERVRTPIKSNASFCFGNSTSPFGVSSPSANVTSANTNTNTTGGGGGKDPVIEMFPHFGERIFAMFVRACDSQGLCSYLSSVAIAELNRLCEPFPEGSPTPSLEAWAERVAASLTLARFWGFLVFSPKWASSQTALENRASSSAFRALFVQLVEDEDRGHVLTEVHRALERCQHQGTSVLVIPWICAFLRVAMRDAVVRETKMFRDLLSTLWVTRLSSDSLSWNRGFGAMRACAEIESLIHDARSARTVLELPVVSSMTASSLGSVISNKKHDQPDGLPNLFDACDLDRPGTSCLALERLRSVLVWALRPVTTGPPPRKVPMESEVQQQQQQQSVKATLARTTTQNKNKAMLEAVFLHYTEDLNRAVEFCIAVIPMSIVESHYSVRSSTNIGTDALLLKAYGEMEHRIEAILDAACPARPREARRAAVEIALHRCEAALVERLLRERQFPPLEVSSTPGTPNVLVARRKSNKGISPVSDQVRLAQCIEAAADIDTASGLDQFSKNLTSLPNAREVRGLVRTPAGLAARAIQALELGASDGAFKDVSRDVHLASGCVGFLSRLVKLRPDRQDEAKRLAQNLLLHAGDSATTSEEWTVIGSALALFS